MFIKQLTIICLLFAATNSHTVAQQMYEVKSGAIDINSNAPNEIIKATSKKLQGIINTETKQFVFKVEAVSFEGFNSPLQREHFNENYMESHVYPDIIFSGKIIEDIDVSKDGEYRVRAKGKLKVHGETANRIIYADIKVKENLVDITSEFKVPLAEHNIRIPRVVNDKLATEVLVKVNAILFPRKK